MKSSGDKKVAYELRCAVLTCRILFKYIFEKKEKKTGMKKDISKKFMNCTIERAGCEDFNKVLACVSNLDRLGRIPSVSDGTELFLYIQNAILRTPNRGCQPEEYYYSKFFQA